MFSFSIYPEEFSSSLYFMTYSSKYAQAVTFVSLTFSFLYFILDRKKRIKPRILIFHFLVIYHLGFIIDILLVEIIQYMI